MSTEASSYSTDRPEGGRRRRTGVGTEIRQGRPFLSTRAEATVSLLRTASVVRRTIERVVEPYGLSLAQYNALRIVKGAGAGGIPTLAIRERMLEEGTTITRLLDKLEAAGLIERERSAPDRRQVLCRITYAGLELCRTLDPMTDEADELCMATLSDAEAGELVRLLDEIRGANAERGAARCSVPARG